VNEGWIVLGLFAICGGLLWLNAKWKKWIDRR
jgi:hypothetical protein